MKEREKTLSERKRENILDAAKRAFLAHGVQGTSMDKLAEMADVSKRTVYNHFSNKEELVLQMLSELWTRTMVEVDLPYDASKPLEGQLRQLLSAETELVSGNEFLGLSRAAAGHYMFQPEKLQAAVQEFPVEDTALYRWITAAMSDGRLRKADANVAFEQLHNLIKGACYWPQLLGLKPALTAEEKKQLVLGSVDLFLDHYRKDA